MPFYDISTAAFAAGASRKWVDNVTSHYAVVGVESTKRGIRREFSFEAVVALTITRVLVQEMGASLSNAIDLSTRICDSGDGMVSLPSGATITFDQEALRREVAQRLREAAESVPRIRRGRPRGGSPENRR